MTRSAATRAGKNAPASIAVGGFSTTRQPGNREYDWFPFGGQQPPDSLIIDCFYYRPGGESAARCWKRHSTREEARS